GVGVGERGEQCGGVGGAVGRDRRGLADAENPQEEAPAERLDQRPAARELPRPGGPPVGRGGAPVKRKSDHSGNLQRKWNRTGLPGGTGMLAPLSVTPATGGARTLMPVSFPLDGPDRPVDLALSCRNEGVPLAHTHALDGMLIHDSGNAPRFPATILALSFSGTSEAISPNRVQGVRAPVVASHRDYVRRR